MDAITIVLFVAGLALAIGGAEALVRGASRLAAALGVSPLVIGLTVVAFGTSSPELAVSVQSSLLGLSGVSLGNVVGSNIFNVLLILGLSALVAPLTVAQQLIRLDVPLMIGVSLVAYLFALDGNVGRFEGVMLFAGIVAYTVFLILESRRESRDIEKEYAQEFGERPRGALQILINLLLVGAGLGMLVIGSRWLIDGAVAIARMLGVSEVVIALTLIAGGTSLPEVATSVVASIRGERDIAVGNIVGSNIFNLLSVLG
ncbi:MAG: calcium/sodium antiporter, partial [Thermoflexales bacterium]|nr:calcium/sodium antiporter [Thermoflexales bacterium]